MNLCCPRLLTGCTLATLSVLALLCFVESVPRRELWQRGGNVLTAEEAYEMFNKWVVHLRRHERPNIYPKLDLYPNDWNFRMGMDFMALGYGLYFRRPGFMLVNMENVMSGVVDSDVYGPMVKGHYINKKEKNRQEPRENDSMPIIYKPHLLKGIKHVYTIPGPAMGIVRVSMADYRDTFKPANGEPPYERYIDYPGEDSLPDIAKLTDQRDICWIVIQNYFFADKMGYNQYEWRYWPVRKQSCQGPICKMVPVIKWILGKNYKTPEERLKRPGLVCRTYQDAGAPIMCHTENRLMRENGTATVSDKKWKLGYWTAGPSIESAQPRDGLCHPEFYAVDLAYLRETLFDPKWEQFFEGGVW